MEDFNPKPGNIKIGGLGPKAQKLQALREKAAAQKSGNGKAHANSSNPAMKAKGTFANTKKTSFNRKAV
jgi:hypothetical protein